MAGGPSDLLSLGREIARKDDFVEEILPFLPISFLPIRKNVVLSLGGSRKYQFKTDPDLSYKNLSDPDTV